ncbi:MAG: hypothetical protein AseanaTS_16630 [Candidatus Pelagadaptatus aseana]|uniref:DUF3301 domain-containing protein n=1 Tax=Candidatus Pelagadaptatus aseana TaxID=3120508 RepID=UPI0039B173D1
MTLYDLMIAFILVLIGLIIWQNAGFRDRALGLAKQQCEHRDVQLLDDTVSLKTLWFGKDRRGNIGLRRVYEFEFTATGERRYRGEMSLLGTRLESVELEPHQFSH